jgi:hypothetical protein
VHYQTAPVARQPLAMSSLIATINRDVASPMTGIIGAAPELSRPALQMTRT